MSAKHIESFVAACTLAFMCGAVPSLAGEREKDAVGPEHAVLATSGSPKAMLFSREAPGKAWKPIDEGGKVYSDFLLLGLPGAKLVTTKGSVTLTFLSDLDGISPYPVIETAVVLRENSKVDLEFTLDRGRADVVNSKKDGPAVVRVHVRNGVWDLTLAEPGARVALETYSRWARGIRFTNDPGPKDEPMADLVVLILKGEVTLKNGSVEFAMKAPPGPSLIEWDSVTGMDDTPHKLEKLPPWASSGQEDTPKAKAKKEMLEAFRKRAADKPVGEVIAAMLESSDAEERRGGTIAAGAFDQLELLSNALRQTKHIDVWDNGVIALRHWIGRAPGQDQMLYNTLVVKRNFTPVQAETVLQLLHSFSDEEVSRPELYDCLIAFLNHDNLAIRGLAYWHLSRLVPEGKTFGYNPMDSKEDRAQSIEKWKKLIPSGQMPPKPRTEAEK